MKEYKVLSLWEPWATLLAYGIKKIETRPGPTSWTIEKGTYLIHAARKWTKELDSICDSEPFKTELHNLNIYRSTYRGIGGSINFGWKESFKLGHIIGAIDVVECCPIFENLQNKIVIRHNDARFEEIKQPELSFGDYTLGRYAWITKNARVLETPIPYKGQQGYYGKFNGDTNQLKFKS